ncbi:MAG: histidine phosphatase family protein [Candidatus Limnocylindrales bacterium]
MSTAPIEPDTGADPATGPTDQASGPMIPAGLDATLVLCRHGETTWIAENRFQGAADPPLSPFGERQAAALADRLADPERPPALPVPTGPPLFIRCSPLRRARATAEAIADRRPNGPPAAPDAALVEISQGDWEGRPMADIVANDRERLAGWRRDPLTTWAPGGESIAQADVRLRPPLRRLLATLGDGRPPGSLDRPMVPGMPLDRRRRHPWGIVVGHDGMLKILLMALFDLPLTRYWSWPFELCGVTVVEILAGRPRLVAHNLADHLAALDDGRRDPH